MQNGERSQENGGTANSFTASHDKNCILSRVIQGVTLNSSAQNSFLVVVGCDWVCGAVIFLGMQIFESPTSHRPIFAAHVFTRRGSEPRRGPHPSPPANCGGCQSHPYRGGRIPNETARTKQLGVRGRPCHKGASRRGCPTSEKPTKYPPPDPGRTPPEP